MLQPEEPKRTYLSRVPMPKHFIMVLRCILITDKIRLFSQCRFIVWISFDVTVSCEKDNINSMDKSFLFVIVHPINFFFFNGKIDSIFTELVSLTSVETHQNMTGRDCPSQWLSWQAWLLGDKWYQILTLPSLSSLTILLVF